MRCLQTASAALLPTALQLPVLYDKKMWHIVIFNIAETPITDLKPHVQVPVLYDKKTQRIVNNESADIIRMMATAFQVP